MPRGLGLLPSHTCDVPSLQPRPEPAIKSGLGLTLAFSHTKAASFWGIASPGVWRPLLRPLLGDSVARSVPVPPCCASRLQTRTLNPDAPSCRQTLTGSPDGVVRLWNSEDVFSRAARAVLRRGGAAASTADSSHSNDSCSQEVMQGARGGFVLGLSGLRAFLIPEMGRRRGVQRRFDRKPTTAAARG